MAINEGFKAQLAKWDEAASGYWEKAQIEQANMVKYNQTINIATSPEARVEALNLPKLLKPIATFFEKQGFMNVGAQKPASDASKALATATVNFQKNLFFYNLYNRVPSLIQYTQLVDAGIAKPTDIGPSTSFDVLGQVQFLAVRSVEDILNNTNILPQSVRDAMTPEELQEAQDALGEMISGLGMEQSLPDMAIDAEKPDLPELVAPQPSAATPVTMYNMTVEEIVRSIGVSPSPDPTMSQEEWAAHLASEGYSDADMEEVDEYGSLASQLANEWIEQNNQLEAFRQGVAEMPDYKIQDILRDAIITPGVALSDMANLYFTHVTQPLAGHAYRHLIPDLEQAYQEFRKTNNTWRAAQLAWQEWDAPGDGAGSWALKYMLMEGVVDPLSYIGLGIPRIAKSIPYIGRAFSGLAKFDNFIMEVMDIPFDGIKSLVKRIPQTTAQRAMVMQHQAGQYIDSWLESYLKKPLNRVTKDEMADAFDKAIAAFRRYPNAVDSPAVNAGRELMRHMPVDEKIVIDWSSRLGYSATKETVSKELVDNINTMIDDYLTKRLSKDAAAEKLARLLNPEKFTDDTFKLAKNIITARETALKNGVNIIKGADNYYKAMRALMKRNYNIRIAVENSSAYLARKQSSRFSSLLQNTSVKLQGIWRNGIDKYIVRPFAEAYLTFGMYGPMNIVEDYIRSALGGVKPGRSNYSAFHAETMGLVKDPLFVLPHEGVVEAWGGVKAVAEEAGAWSNNWLLRLLSVGRKDWAEKIYNKLVRMPGAYGTEIRMNFVLNRFRQILAENGGDAFQALAKITAKEPILSDKRLLKEVVDYASKLKVTGLSDAIRQGADEFTIRKITGKELDNILLEHPSIPNDIRGYIRQEMLDSLTPEDIQRVSLESNTRLIDDFVASPDRAREQFKALADELVGLEIKTPEELAQAMYSLNYMAQVYGTTPKQVMKQLTTRSFGLPAEARTEMFTKGMDRLALFLDDGTQSLKRVVDKLRIDVSKSGNQAYIDMSNQYFDTLIAKNLKVSDFRMEDLTFRQEYFAGVSAKERTAEFWDEFKLRLNEMWERFDLEMLDMDDLLHQLSKDVDRTLGISEFSRPAVKVVGRPLSPADIAAVLGTRVDDITSGLLSQICLRQDKERFVRYVMGYVRDGTDVGFTKESVGEVYDQIVNSLHVANLTPLTQPQMELDAIRQELLGLYNSKRISPEDIAEIQRYFGDIAKGVDDAIANKAFVPGDYQKVRQSSMDEANKWYYKEYTDYTHANAFDAMMKSIYPYWTYESQRWFWLPRAFLRHPGMFTSFERFQNNTDGGYIHIPGTSMEINPFRGTVFGILTTRLTRQDYPEYYDSLGVAGGYVGFMDALSRYGFYPGAHFSIPLAMFGGIESQLGETLPAIWKTPLNLVSAALPKSEAVQFIRDRIFPDRFRDYLTMLRVNALGGDGLLIFAKRQENKPLTDEENSVWEDARQGADLYSALFEQTGMFRYRPDEQVAIAKAAAIVIQEMTGYTPDQQDWLRTHGYNVWDMIGGISPEQQRILEEMGYYKYVGLARPLLPSRQQEEYNRLELAWNAVETYSNSTLDKQLQLQKDFLFGVIGARDFEAGIKSTYDDQRQFIDDKEVEFPLMNLEERLKFMQETSHAAPVMHPLKELLNLYFSIELKEKIDPGTGEKMVDWDTFLASRKAIENAVPDYLKPQWEAEMGRRSVRMVMVRAELMEKYFRKYYDIWDAIAQTYSPEEQALIKEYNSLESRGINPTRQEEIKAMVSVKTGNQLISSFRSEVATARQALRFANPILDAWLNYWGRVSSFLTPEAEAILPQLNRDTGRRS